MTKVNGALRLDKGTEDNGSIELIPCDEFTIDNSGFRVIK